jgi:hypothetical protein
MVFLEALCARELLAPSGTLVIEPDIIGKRDQNLLVFLGAEESLEGKIIFRIQKSSHFFIPG